MLESEGPGEPLASQYLADELILLKPDRARQIIPPITTGTPHVFHLPALLYLQT